jgi:hypothetical protein
MSEKRDQHVEAGRIAVEHQVANTAGFGKERGSQQPPYHPLPLSLCWLNGIKVPVNP